MFYIRPPSKKGFKYWEIVKHLVKHCPEIIEYTTRKSRPFSYSFHARSSSLNSLDE